MQQTRGGLEITLSRIMLLGLGELAADPDNQALAAYMRKEGYTTVGVISIEVVNYSDDPITVHPSQGTIVCGDEQVDTNPFLSDRLGGEYYGGVRKAGDVVFFLANHDPAMVDSLRYVISAPYGDSFRRLAEDDFDFVVELTTH